jgi:hypothetical protein
MHPQQYGLCAGLSGPAQDALPAVLPEKLYDNSEAERALLQLGARWRAMTEQAGQPLPAEAALVQQQQVCLAMTYMN